MQRRGDEMTLSVRARFGRGVAISGVVGRAVRAPLGSWPLEENDEPD